MTTFPISISSDPFTAEDSTIQVKDWSWHQCWWEQLEKAAHWTSHCFSSLMRINMEHTVLVWRKHSRGISTAACQQTCQTWEPEGTVFDPGSLLSTTLLQFTHLGIVLKQAVNDACAFCADLDWHLECLSAAKDRGPLLNFSSSVWWK